MLSLAESIVELLSEDNVDIEKVKELIINLAYKVEEYDNQN
jgi:hypothetical protein